MRIEFIELANFRKLLSVRVDFGDELTLFVGANNSGKTSAMVALRRFLIEQGKRFKPHDFTLCHWIPINEIGKSWEASASRGEVPEFTADDWAQFLPALDIWLGVESDELHHVSSLIPTLDWSGGLLGVRFRLEPKDPELLFQEYIAAVRDAEAVRAAAAEGDAPGSDGKARPRKLTLWPKDMIDFFGRRMSQHLTLRAYLLDPGELVNPKGGQAYPQTLAADAQALDGDPLAGLIRIHEINAQRGLGESEAPELKDGEERRRESRRLSDQLQAYYRTHLDPEKRLEAKDLDALQAIEAAQDTFDDRLRHTFAAALKEVEGLGYPGVTDPKLQIATKLHAMDGLNHEAAVSFEIDVSGATDGSMSVLRLPEGSNGLGYQNLISMVFRLMSFRDAWMRVGKAETGLKESVVEPLHLVLVEEPEAHLHAQVQQVFIKKAYKVLRDHPDLGDNRRLCTQLVVSTHSSHVAHEADFSHLRYFRRLPAGMCAPIPASEVINLSAIFGEGHATDRLLTVISGCSTLICSLQTL